MIWQKYEISTVSQFSDYNEEQLKEIYINNQCDILGVLHYFPTAPFAYCNILSFHLLRYNCLVNTSDSGLISSCISSFGYSFLVWISI